MTASSSVDGAVMAATLGSVFLIFSCLLSACAARKAVKASVEFEYDAYSCEAQTATAVVSLSAGGRGKPLLSLTSVLDVSKSMDDSEDKEEGELTKLELLQRTNNFIVDHLQREKAAHKFGIVTFSSDVEELSPLQVLTPEATQAIKKKINDTEAQGLTALLDGTLKGLEQQTSDEAEKYIRAVFVFTDGEPTEGEIREKRIVKKVKKAVRKADGDVFLYTFGYGDVNYDLLRKMGEIGGGVSYIIHQEKDIPQAFGAALGGLLTEVATKLKLHIKPKAGAKIASVLHGGTQKTLDDGSVEIFLGDLFKQETRDIVVYLNITENCEATDTIDVDAIYRDAVSFKNVTSRAHVTPITRRPYVEPVNGTTDAGVHVTRFETAKTLKIAADALKRDKPDDCIRIMEVAKQRFVETGYIKRPYIKAIKADLDTIKTDIGQKPEEEQHHRAALDGVIDALEKQRTGLTDKDKYKTVFFTSTASKRKTSATAASRVFEKSREKYFPMNVTHEVAEGGVGNDTMDLEVTLTIRPIKTGDLESSLSITTVLDQSGSMDGRPFDLLIDAQKILIDYLVNRTEAEEIDLGIIFFADEVTTFLPLTDVDDIDREKWNELKKQLDDKSAMGGTSLGAALRAGIDQQIKSPKCAGLQAVYVFTDGEPTDGEPADILKKVKAQLGSAKEEILIYTFALGNVKPFFIDGLDDLTPGGKFILNRTEEALPAFGQSTGQALSSLAKHVKIDIEPASDDVEIVSISPAPKGNDTRQTVAYDVILEGEKRDVFIVLRVPKDKVPPQLLNVEMAYQDALTCDILESDKIEIASNITGTTDRRRIEVEVVDTLRDSVALCKAGTNISDVLADVDEAIEIVYNASMPGVLEDLSRDLFKVRSLIKEAIVGERGLEEACLTLEVFVDVVESQRSEGIVDLEVQKTYGTEKQDETRSIFTGRPKRPKRDPFMVRYVEAPDEISSAPQNFTMKMRLDAIDKPKEPLPSSVIFVVDASKGVQQKELDWMKSIIDDTRASFEKSQVYKTSSMGIIIHGEDVTMSLKLTPFPKTTTEAIDDIFAEIKPSGGDGYFKAVERGIDELSKITGYDLVMITFIGGQSTSLSTFAARRDARTFRILESDLKVRLTFIPIILKPGTDAKAYFKAYPSWVQQSIVQSSVQDDVIARIRPKLYDVAAKRVRVRIQPHKSVQLQSVGLGLPITSTEFMLDDVVYEEKRRIPIKLGVGWHLGHQTLFYLSFTYEDMRSFYRWEKKAQGYSVKRLPERVLRALEEIRDRLIGISPEIKASAEKEDYNKTLYLTSKEMAVIKRMPLNHPALKEIRDGLKDILQKTHAVIEKDFKKPDLIKLIESFEKQLDVQTYIAEAEKSEEPEPPEEKGEEEEEESIPPKPIEKLAIDVDDAVPIPDTAVNVTVDVKIDPPLRSGLLVDADATIIIDASSLTSSKTIQLVASSLLTSLAGRRAVRSIEILTWNQKLTSIYTNDNFNRSNIEEAMKKVTAIRPSGSVDYSVVINDGIVRALKSPATIKVLYVIVTSNIPRGEMPSTLIRDAEKLLSSGTATLAVIGFYSRLDRRSAEFLDELGRLSGGAAYPLDQPRGTPTETDLKDRIDDATRDAAVWIDDSFCKDVVIDLKALGDASVLDVRSKSEFRVKGRVLSIPSQRYDKAIPLKVTVGIGRKGRRLLQKQTGNLTRLLSIAGQYYNLRTEKTEFIPESVVSVEPLPQKTLDRMDRLQYLLKEVAENTMKELGFNRLEEALISVTQSQILSEYSGIDERPEVEEDKDNYASIEQDLETYASGRDNVTSIQEATEDIGDLQSETPYTSDMGSFLKLKHTPISVVEAATEYTPTIDVNIEDDSVTDGAREVAITAVFDAVDYATLVDKEVPSLRVQKRIVDYLIEQLIEDEGFSVTLTAVASRYKDITALTPIALDSENVHELKPYLKNVNASGSPVDLYSSLEAGLKTLQTVSDTTERIVLVFSSAYSICLVEDPRYEALLVPYITYPINPVRVLTYIVGFTESPKVDLVSDLTSGKRYTIEQLRDIFPVIDNSIKQLKNGVIRGVRLHVTPETWNKRPVELGSGETRIQSYPIWTAALRDMKAGVTQSVRLKNALDEWKGDADLLRYSVSYFRSDRYRWYITPEQTIRIRRAPPIVLEERKKQKMQSTEALNKGFSEVAKKKLPEAVESIEKGLKELDASPFQDDSIVLDLVRYLSIVRDDFIKLEGKNDAEIEAFIEEHIAAAENYDLFIEIDQSPKEEDSPIKSTVFFVGMVGALGIAALIA